MVLSPTELNSLRDDELRQHVDAVLQHLNDPTSGRRWVKIAPFVTADILLRLHNLVAAARRDKNPCGGWSKQATLARVVGCFTGIDIKQSDAEYIGNAEDYFLHDYNKSLAKAIKTDKNRAHRARKAGKELPTNLGCKERELKLQLYACKFGGVPRNVISQDKKSIPVRHLQHADEVNKLLQEEIIKLKHGGETTYQEREMQHNLNALCAAVEAERRARGLAEQHVSELQMSQEDQAAKAAERLQELKRKVRDADVESQRIRGQVARLGSQLIAAHVEVGRATEREEQAREEAQQSASALKAAKESEASAIKIALYGVQQKVRDANSECKRLRGEVARLGSQLCTAHVEVARAAERESQVRQEAEKAASDATKQQVEAVAAVTQELQSLHARMREQARESRYAEGKMQRLGCQLGSALVEAARAAEQAKEAYTVVDRLKERLKEQERDAEEKVERLRFLKSQMARRARAADRRAGEADSLKVALLSTRQRLREVRKELNCTRVQLNLNASNTYDESDSGEECGVECSPWSDNESELDEDEASLALKRMRSMPTWRPLRGKGQGKGEAKMEWGTRLTIYSLLAMMVPPSAIGTAIVAIVRRTAPWLNPAAPTYETIKRCRFELRFVEEAIAARRVAAAYRIRAIGFDETTKLGMASLTSNVQIESEKDAPLEDVILRAAYCPLGGTSELQVQSIEAKCFSRLRDFLRRWKDMFQNMYPSETWTGPDPSRCSLHRLGGGGAIITDTCNAARKARKLLAELVAEQVRSELGSEIWDTMSDEDREQAVRTHHVDCWQHLRNIFLAEMSAAQAKHVQAELQPELDTFAAWERMTTNFSQLLRASFKEFHHSCRYYKGQGRTYTVWLLETYPTEFAIHLERADGGRQDLDYDAAVPLFVNRKYFIEFLHERVFLRQHSNILEDFLYVTFSSQQYIAMARANALIDVLISRPLRWLSGKSDQLQSWSPRSMGTALDLVEQFFERAQHDGSLFLDCELDIFKPIADEQPLFAAWRHYSMEEDVVRSPDGSTKHLVWKRVLTELRSPADSTNIATRAKCIEYLEVQCVAALRKMHDPKLAVHDQLTSQDGRYRYDNSDQAHIDLIGCHATNDTLAESVFGTYDMILRRCPGISMEAASGVAQAVRSATLSLGDVVAHRKASCRTEAKAGTGWFFGLPEKEQESLVELARLTVKEMRDQDLSDHRTLDEYHKARRKKNEEDELDVLFTQYALAMSFFERWCKRAADLRTITPTLNGYGDRVQEKLDWLREQIEMRTIGLSWTDWTTPWSSSKDEYVGSEEQLSAHLREVLKEEQTLSQRGLLPSKSKALENKENFMAECPAPQLKRKTFKALGTPTVQVGELCSDRTDITPEEAAAAAQKRRVELEVQGEIDWVADRQPYPTGQGPVPDKALVGKMLEVRWRYRHKVTGEPVYIWCEGEVVQAADGETDKKSARCRKVLPAGALRIKWPADVVFDEDESYVWSMLNPKAFNKDVHLGWRFAGSELRRMEQEEQAQASKNRPQKRSNTRFS